MGTHGLNHAELHSTELVFYTFFFLISNAGLPTLYRLYIALLNTLWNWSQSNLIILWNHPRFSACLFLSGMWAFYFIHRSRTLLCVIRISLCFSCFLPQPSYTSSLCFINACWTHVILYSWYLSIQYNVINWKRVCVVSILVHILI